MEGRNATQKPMQISQRVMEGRNALTESNSRALTEACVWPRSKQPPDDEVKWNSCAVLLV